MLSATGLGCPAYSQLIAACLRIVIHAQRDDTCPQIICTSAHLLTHTDAFTYTKTTGMMMMIAFIITLGEIM